MLARVQVEHEVDQRAREPRAGAAAARRTARRRSSCARSKSRMPSAGRGPSAPSARSRTPGGSPTRRTSALSSALAADGHARVRQVGQRQQQRARARPRAPASAASSSLICWPRAWFASNDRRATSSPAFFARATSSAAAFCSRFSASTSRISARRSLVERRRAAASNAVGVERRGCAAPRGRDRGGHGRTRDPAWRKILCTPAAAQTRRTARTTTQAR